MQRDSNKRFNFISSLSLKIERFLKKIFDIFLSFPVQIPDISFFQ